MRKNINTPKAHAGLTPGAAPATSNAVAEPKTISAASRFANGFLLKQIPLRIQLRTATAESKKTGADWIKTAALKSSKKGRPINRREVEDQRVRNTPYPASNAQSVNCQLTGHSTKKLKLVHNGI